MKSVEMRLSEATFVSEHGLRGSYECCKGKGQTLVIAPQVAHYNHRGAQVHDAHRAASHIPALYLPDRSRYSFTDPERMEG